MQISVHRAQSMSLRRPVGANGVEEVSILRRVAGSPRPSSRGFEVSLGGGSLE